MPRRLSIRIAVAASLVHVACRPSTPSLHSEARPVDAGHAAGGEATVAPPAPDPCASARADEVEAHVMLDPIHVGFAPNRVVVFGAGVYVPLFPLLGSDEGSDRLSCSAATVDAGSGASEVRVNCQDGPQAKSATVRLSGDKFEIHILDDGRQTERSEPAKPCARLIAGDLSMTRWEEPEKPRTCQRTGAARSIDGFLRRGTASAKTGLLPLFLEIPALGLRPSLGEAAADPELCVSGITERGWAYVKCGAGEDAFYAKMVPLPGELVIDRVGVNQGPRQRIAIPCDVRLVLHDLPCLSDCRDH